MIVPWCQTHISNYDILHGRFRFSNRLSLWCLVPWIHHLPRVCWSTFWILVLKQQLVCKFVIMENTFFIFFQFFFCICVFTYSKLACLCQSIEINNRCVYRKSQVRKPTGSGVVWAECSPIIGTGYWVHAFSLILDSSVGLSASIQSAGNLVPETLVRILHSAEEDNWSLFDSKIAGLCHSIGINNSTHIS